MAQAQCNSSDFLRISQKFDIINPKVEADMTAVTMANASKNIYALAEQVCETCEPVILANENGKNVVLISEKEWRGIEDTRYLNSIPGMAESLIKGKNMPLSECIPEEKFVW